MFYFLKFFIIMAVVIVASGQMPSTGNTATPNIEPPPTPKESPYKQN